MIDDRSILHIFLHFHTVVTRRARERVKGSSEGEKEGGRGGKREIDFEIPTRLKEGVAIRSEAIRVTGDTSLAGAVSRK